MRLENDITLNELYDEEFEKIPYLFRFSRKRLKTFLIVMAVSFVLMLIFTTVLFKTREIETLPSLAGYQPVPLYSYNGLVLFLLITFAVITILMSAWIVIAQWFERRAFKKASLLSSRIYISRRNSVEKKWQDWKTMNRFD